MTRTLFQQNLESLKGYISKMGELSHEALVNSVQALSTHDLELGEKVIQGDEIIDEYELKIEKCVTQLISRQNPTAGDMRLVISCFKIAIDLERMSDLAVDIASITKCIKQENTEPLDNILKMAELCDEILKQTLKAFEILDKELARATALKDDEIDKLFYGTQTKLIEMMREDKAMISNASYLLLILRYLERFGDHACNICESIFYITEGQRVDLN